ncbi:MAG: AraC family transcriptional regulator [Sphingobacteriales bacterium]|nr:MAG: AraC family transcriptional regulator [Sphingobacteriales bacterium]
MQNISFNTQLYTPAEQLQNYVQFYTYTEVEGETKEFFVDLFPVGYCVISFILNDGSLVVINDKIFTAKATITGQLMQHYKVRVNNIHKFVYILFKPLGTFELLKIKQHKLAFNFTDISTLELPNYQTFLLNTSNFAVKDISYFTKQIDRWLITLINEVKTDKKLIIIKKIIDFINCTEEKILLKNIYQKFKISKTSLELHFKEKLGLSPKQYIKFVRFNKAYELIKNGYSQPWANIVYQNDYFDQSHFIKDFKKMFGYTPSQFYKSTVNIATHIREKITQEEKL